MRPQDIETTMTGLPATSAQTRQPDAMFIKILLLAALIRLLIATDKPFLCSGIYAGVLLLFGLAFSSSVAAVLISVAIGFVLASIYFWVLNRLDSGSVAWWLVAVLGIAVGLV